MVYRNIVYILNNPPKLNQVREIILYIMINTLRQLTINISLLFFINIIHKFEFFQFYEKI